jgi:hypothetical protein
LPILKERGFPTEPALNLNACLDLFVFGGVAVIPNNGATASTEMSSSIVSTWTTAAAKEAVKGSLLMPERRRFLIEESTVELVLRIDHRDEAEMMLSLPDGGLRGEKLGGWR